MSSFSFPPLFFGGLAIKPAINTNIPTVFLQKTNCPAPKLPFKIFAAPPITEKPSPASNMNKIPLYLESIFINS